MFTPEEKERVTELARIYVQAKSLILYSEEADPDSRSNIQIVKELRDAFDHFMRVIVAHTDPNSPHREEESYGEKNLQKAIGHVYRATFDALDGTVVSLKSQIFDLLKPYPREVINDVVKDYWEIRTKLNELTERIANHRANKDVNENVGKLLDAYTQDVDELKDFYKRLHNAAQTLEDSHQRLKKNDKRNLINQLIIAISSAIAGGILVWWIS